MSSVVVAPSNPRARESLEQGGDDGAPSAAVRAVGAGVRARILSVVVFAVAVESGSGGRRSGAARTTPARPTACGSSSPAP